MNAKKIANIIIEAFESGNKLLICGNGGSAAESLHMAAELVGKYRENHRPLPAISLVDNPSIITAIANDFGYEQVFSRQVQAFGEKGDILLCISTSGKSRNVLDAKRVALYLKMIIIDLPNKGKDNPAIQENHLKAIHEICGTVEAYFNTVSPPGLKII